MMEREQLEQAIRALEAQRAGLGDAVVEAALTSLREKLTSINPAPAAALGEPGMSPAEHASPPTGERRVVTVLFCDVKGSTAMAEKLDPEVWARTIQGAMEFLIEPVRSHDGTVAQVMGDGILAFFGAPLAHEDDPQRAILAGLEIIAGVHIFHEQVKRELELDFSVRVGIHTGLAVVGEVGEGQQIKYTAIGDTVNLAARMEQTARPGTVQISEQTYKLIEQMFECEPLGEMHVKGKHAPVRAYRVTGIKAEPGPVRGLERQGLQSSLVGREAELTRLKEAINRLLTGQGGVVSLLGEAGVGKSRLIAEVYRDIPAAGLCWLEGHTLSYNQTIPYWPFQEILRCYADITHNDDEDQAWRKLESKVAALFPENAVGTATSVAEILPYLASLLALPVRGDYIERVKYLDGEALGKQIFLAARRFFEQLARTSPVVLVFEDLHWVDESSVTLLEHLLPLVEHLPLLIVSLSRFYLKTPAAHFAEVIAKEHAGRYTEIHLAPLSPSDSKQLIHNLLEIENLPGRVRELIVGKAEGNPFFLEEILRALIDLGAIRRDPASGRWRATAEIESLAIPDTVQGVILARVDRLEENLKNALRVASVIGRSFLYRVLQTINESGGRLDTRLAALQATELIQEKQPLPELEYIFKHALVQEATYESILLQTRRELHGRVGRAIEFLFAERLEEFYGLLAYHYARAEVWEKAQSYLLKAADQAGRMAADGEALAHYRQALTAYERAFGDQWDPLQRAALERKMGEAYFRRGEISEALKCFYQALAYFGHPLPAAGWATHLAFLQEIIEQIVRSRIPGLRLLHKPAPGADEELRIYQAIEYSGGAGNPELFLLTAFRMLNFSERNGLPDGVAMGCAGLGVLFYYVNLPRLAKHYLQRAVSLSEQLQRRDVLGFAPTILMIMEALQGHWEAVFEYGQQAAETYREIGNLGARAVSLSVAGVLSVYEGDFTRALAYGDELAQFGKDAADRLMWGDALGVRGYVEQRLGRLEEASLHLRQAIEITETSGNIYFRLLVGNELGRCYLRQGKWQAALETLATNREFIVKNNFRRDPQSNAGLRNGYTWAYLLAAEQGDPRDRAGWLKKARRACREGLKWGQEFRLEKPEAFRLQGRYCWLSGDKEGAERWWDQSLTEAGTLRMRYEKGLTHLEIGLRMNDRPHLEKAKAIFTELGAAFDLDRARENF